MTAHDRQKEPTQDERRARMGAGLCIDCGVKLDPGTASLFTCCGACCAIAYPPKPPAPSLAVPDEEPTLGIRACCSTCGDDGRGRVCSNGWHLDELPALRSESEALRRDKERLDWMEARVDGTGEALSFGGACYWSLEVQRSRRGKLTRLGEGDDLRDAIDDAIDAARSPVVIEGTANG